MPLKMTETASGLLDAAQFLQKSDHICIVCHVNPDGDTLGSAYALAGILEVMGKQVRVCCASPIPKKYNYLKTGLALACTRPQHIVAVDIAGISLWGSLWEELGSKCDLLIDHHVSNAKYANLSVIDPTASSTSILILQLCGVLGVSLTKQIANAVFTGITTDTGCFRYSNTNALTFEAGMVLAEAGAETAMINKLMFETKTRAEMEIMRLALDSIEFHFDGRCAILYVTLAMREKSGFYDEDLGEIAALPRRVEGVSCGITIKEKTENEYKISFRTTAGVNANEIAARFGGGGHVRAAGCTIIGNLEEVKAKLISAVGDFVN